MDPFEELDDLEETLVEDAGQPDDPTEPPWRAPTPDHSRFRGFNRRSQSPLPEPEPTRVTERPLWMQNNLLLPKRPPGKR